MLIDDLDKTARQRIGAIFTRIEGMGLALEEKNALMGHLVAVKDLLPTLDVQGLQFVNKTLGKILDTLLPSHRMVMLEPITALFLGALKFLAGGQEPEGEGVKHPSHGLGMGR